MYILAKSTKLFSVLFLMICTSVFSQDVNEPLIIFKSDNPVLSFEEEYSYSKFLLKANKDQLEYITMKADELASVLDLKTEKSESGKKTYKCVLKFKYNADLTYLHKMLKTFEVKQFEYDGKVYGMDRFLSIVKQ